MKTINEIHNDLLWKDCVTLEERVIKLIKEQKTESEEFLSLINIYGRAKLVEIYKKNRSIIHEHKKKKQVSEVESKETSKEDDYKEDF